MQIASAIILSVSLVALAGCFGGGAPAQRSENADRAASASVAHGNAAPATAATSAGTGPAARSVVNWTGFMKVGAGYEVPSHMEETSKATRAVWSPSFQYEMPQAPRDVQIRLDWTAPAAQMQFMVVLQDNATATEATVETEFSDHGPLCVRIPPDHLSAGRYSIMAHSKVAVDARFTFTVSALWGEGRLVDEPHAFPALDLPEFLAETAIGEGAGVPLEPLPCQGT